MALAPGHRFGQIIGNVLEAAIKRHLEEFAEAHQLYLDKRGKPSVRGKKQKATWTDKYGNLHDLDFVLERGGSDTEVGIPVIFTESAWRRYTKHSRNKAQEIQAAILPIREAFDRAAPHVAAILAGVFTSDSIRQMESQRFRVSYLPYERLVNAFNQVGIDATYGEDTSDAALQQKVDRWSKLRSAQQGKVIQAVYDLLEPDMAKLKAEIAAILARTVQAVRVIPLHGTPEECVSVWKAIQFIQHYSETASPHPIAKYEIQIRYSNGDHVDGQFRAKPDAIEFLETFEAVVSAKLKELKERLGEEDAIEE